MRETSSIILNKIIIHVLDKNLSEPLLADFEQDITEEIHELIEKHVVRPLRDDDNRIAKFKLGKNIVRDSCSNIICDDESFVEESKKIADHLFSTMKTKGNISSCDLVICLYTVENEKYVAILKMDYRKSYTHDIEVIDNKYKILIKTNETGLPQIGQRLQKCAFIKTYEVNNIFDLVILDNQQQLNNDIDIAQFFVDDFLNCNLILDSKDKTKLFRNITEKWVRHQLRQDIGQAKKVRDVLSDNLKNEEEINIRSFVEEAMDGNEEIQNDYIDFLNNNGFQITSFEVNKPWIDRKFKKKSIKTDTGFEIKSDRDCFDDNLKYHVKRNGDGTIDIIIKNVVNYIEK